jgi:valyl-tRNA synthetase
MLRLLHPFLPFVTEELWQRLKLQGAAEANQPVSISLAYYPKPAPIDADDHSRTFELLRSIVTAARELRADNKLDAKQIYVAAVRLNDSEIPAEDLEIAGRLTRLAVTESANALPGGGLLRSLPEFELRIEAQAPVSNGAASTESRARLEKKNRELRGLIDSHKRQLEDERFLSKAPAKLIETMKAKLADYVAQLSKNEDQLRDLE